MAILVRSWMKRWWLLMNQMQALLKPEQFRSSELICDPSWTAYSSGQPRGFPAHARHHTGPDLGDSMLFFVWNVHLNYRTYHYMPYIAEVGVPQSFPNWWSQETSYSPNAMRQLQKNFKLLASPSWRRRWIPKLYIDLSKHMQTVCQMPINLRCLHKEMGLA